MSVGIQRNVGRPCRACLAVSLLCAAVARRALLGAGAESLEDGSLKSVRSKPGHSEAGQGGKGYQGKGSRHFTMLQAGAEVLHRFAPLLKREIG